MTPEALIVLLTETIEAAEAYEEDILATVIQAAVERGDLTEDYLTVIPKPINRFNPRHEPHWQRFYTGHATYENQPRTAREIADWMNGQ